MLKILVQNKIRKLLSFEYQGQTEPGQTWSVFRNEFAVKILLFYHQEASAE